MIIHSIEGNTETWRDESGRLHRLDGPASITLGFAEYWCFENKLHRTDGPAITYYPNERYWYLHDHYFSSFRVWLEVVDRSPAEKVLLKMQYG